MYRKWTDKELRNAVKISRNLADVCRALDLTIKGATYPVLKKHIERLQLNISHFEKRKSGRKEKLTDDKLFCRSKVSQSSLRKRARELIEYKCSNCGIRDEWCEKPISLQLDHIDGNRDNNELSNLRWMCPNCHSQTETWGARRRRQPKPSEINPNWRNADRINGRKVERPSKEELKELIDIHNNFVYIGSLFGVSDNAVRKWARRYELM